jgi:CubicO group peptidase (beta-lactamase class C family)
MMIRANLLAGAVCAAMMVSGCQSVPPPAPEGAAGVPQHESYSASDEELRELLQSLVADGHGKGLVLGLLEPDGGRRLILYGNPGTGPRAHELQREAGDDCDYSNLGFGLLGYVVTRVAGLKTIGEFIRERSSGRST